MAIAEEPPLTLAEEDGILPVPPRLETFEEFLVWATENDVRAEWVDGEVIVLLPSSAVHQLLVGFLVALFQHWIEARVPGGTVLSAPFLMRLGDSRPRRRGSAREPDILYVAPEHAERLQGTRLEGPADIAVEIVSPESQRRDRDAKFFEYERAGVREYWLIDPQNQEAEFYRRDDDGAYRRVAPDEAGVYESAALAGFRLDTAWLWQSPLPPLLGVLRTWNVIE